MSRRVGISALLALPLWLLAASAHAQATDAAQRSQQEAAAEQKLGKLRTQIAQLVAEQKALDSERDSATAELREADRTVSEAVRALRRTEVAIAGQEVELTQLQSQQAQLEAGLSKQREALATLVRSAYALGRHEQLKLLLAQDRMADLARVLAYHRYFQHDRQQRISGLLAALRSSAEMTRPLAH